MAKRTRLNKEAEQALEDQTKAFIAKFGRAPGPNDPIFFDPDSDVPRPYPEEKLKAEMLAAMRDAGIPPQFIYAYERTGVFVNENGYKSLSPADRREYNASIDEYFRLEKEAKKSRA
jgi:hypothetical protein